MYDAVIVVTESDCEFLDTRICTVRRVDHLDLYIDKRDMTFSFATILGKVSNWLNLILVKDSEKYLLSYSDPLLLKSKVVRDDFILSVKGQPERIEDKTIEDVLAWWSSLPETDAV